MGKLPYRLETFVVRLLRAAVSVCALTLAWSSSEAQTYPARPIKIIVAYPPGGLFDATVRQVAEQVSSSIGQAVIVDNRPGGNTFIGMTACSGAPPDGYTLCAAVPDSMIFNPLLFKKLPYDAAAGFTPIANLAEAGGLIAVSAGAPFSSFPELIRHAKANPGSINWATWGPGSIPDVYRQWLEQQYQVKFTAVPYKGAGQVLPALLGGQVDVSYLGVTVAAEHIKSGRLRPIVLARRERIAVMPSVPVQSEFGADPQLQIFFGIFGPANLPRFIVDLLASEFDKATRAPRLQAFFKNNYLETVGGSASDFSNYLARARQRAEEQFKAFGIVATEAPN